MAKLIDLPLFSDQRGSLAVMQNILPFTISRVYWIFGASGIRGGHRHKNNMQALVCVNGSCNIKTNNGVERKVWSLDSPSKLLILESIDWHTMENFSKDAVLIVFASSIFDPDDYIDEDYEND